MSSITEGVGIKGNILRLPDFNFKVLSIPIALASAGVEVYRGICALSGAGKLRLLGFYARVYNLLFSTYT